MDNFEAALSNWKQEQDKPWNRLGYQLIEHNLKKHIPMDSRPLRILDAGGGNGHDSLQLARMNHHIDLADISQQMLNDACSNAALAGVSNRLQTHAIDILDVADVFAEGLFDVVLCHNVIQFVDETRALLERLYKVLAPGGFLSLVSTNQYSLPYQAAFMEQNLDKAFELLDTGQQHNPVFDLSAHEFRPDEVIECLTSIGFDVDKHYGIRCLYNYWGTNKAKKDSAIFDKLRHLELELTERHPYKLTARQFQLIARK